MAKSDGLTDAEFTRAQAAGRREVSPRAMRARFDRRRNRIVIDLDTGLEIAFRPGDAEGLGEASAEQLSTVEVSGGGAGLYFPALDVDFSIPRLVDGYLGSGEWMKREARAKASRANGKLGGRPRKTLTAAE